MEVCKEEKIPNLTKYFRLLEQLPNIAYHPCLKHYLHGMTGRVLSGLYPILKGKAIQKGRLNLVELDLSWNLCPNAGILQLNSYSV